MCSLWFIESLMKRIFSEIYYVTSFYIFIYFSSPSSYFCDLIKKKNCFFARLLNKHKYIDDCITNSFPLWLPAIHNEFIIIFKKNEAYTVKTDPNVTRPIIEWDNFNPPETK